MRLARRIGLMIVVLLLAFLTTSAIVGGTPILIQFGKVLDAATDKPVPGVRVVAIYTGSPLGKISPGVAETVTDSIGRYVLSLWGQAWVVYMAAGHESIRLVYPDELVECDSCCGKLKDVKLKR